MMGEEAQDFDTRDVAKTLGAVTNTGNYWLTGLSTMRLVATAVFQLYSRHLFLVDGLTQHLTYPPD